MSIAHAIDANPVQVGTFSQYRRWIHQWGLEYQPHHIWNVDECGIGDGMVVDKSYNFKSALMYVLGYHWLPLATIDLVGDNREFEVLGIFLDLKPIFGV